ncbi:MAG: ATP:cob(I)alamin adenosyltransferase [Ignavibacteria bacterium GWF2_33_9]|nr:MAG: ATP:cob(I)alamin adenosyltransferase [Ignavibacteria bacterium GWF2_33_9]
MKIYTKSGDDGTTGLFNGKRVKKFDLRVECYGTVDELASVVGLAVSFGTDEVMKDDLQEISHKLFRFASDLATPLNPPAKFKIARIEQSDIDYLENKIDTYDLELEPLRNFIISGGTNSAAFLHLARTVSRRAERRIIELNEKEDLGEFAVKFINRLSDYLFTAARIANSRAGKSDILLK